MNGMLDPLAIARQPTQQRARARFERILEEAEALLAEGGLSAFSIPAIAERLGYTRGSVYAYFPTPYALLNELVQRDLAKLEAVFQDHAQGLLAASWQDAVQMAIGIAVDYYNRHPAAALLILGGAVTDTSYRAQELTNQRLGQLAAAIWRRQLALPRGRLDVMTLAVDIGTACLRRSFFEHGRVTPPYRQAAAAAMIAFLTPYAEPAKAPAARSRKR